MNSNVTPSLWRRPRFRLAQLVLTLPVALTMTLALQPAQASTSSAQAFTIKSAVTRLVPGSGLNSGPVVKLVQLKLSPGTYRVDMTLTVHQSNPDPVDYVDVSLLCKDNYGHADQLGQAVNTLHGTSFTLHPRFYITMTGPQRGVCVGSAYMGRIQGTASASASSRTISILSATLVATPVNVHASETVRYLGGTSANSHPLVGHSALAKPAAHFHAGPVAFTLDASQPKSFSLSSNVFMTGCTSPGGSRDKTTNGRNLCQTVFKFTKAGPLVRTRMVVQQYAADAKTVCRIVVVPNTTTTFRISANRHHLPVMLDGSVTLSPKAGCGSHALAFTEVYVESGPSVVVHFPSTMTSVVPA